jgi:predicted AlkP superfamily pyrophosphatase or phosphodiesterase
MNTKAHHEDATPGIRPDPLNGIVNLMGSLIEGLGGQRHSAPPLQALLPEEIRDYRQVLLLVVDGLGMAPLRALSPDGLLARSVRTQMTSVFPSTTATAVTSLMTGLYPSEHGLTGWHMYFRELGTVLAVLPGKPRYGGVPWGASGVDLKKLLGLSPIFDRIQTPSSLVTPHSISDSPFNRVLRGQGEVTPYGDLEDFFARLERGITKTTGRHYHYAYWSEFDHMAHAAGPLSQEAQEHLKAFEAAFEGLLRKIEGSSTLVIVTADHGFIDHDPASVISLWDYPEIETCLSLPLSGEARAAYAYVKPGREALFERAVTDLLGDQMTLYRSTDLHAAGWFGTGLQHPRFLDRIGDYVLLPAGRGIIRDAVFGEKKTAMVGYHGGVHPDEMWVPLIVCGN